MPRKKRPNQPAATGEMRAFGCPEPHSPMMTLFVLQVTQREFDELSREWKEFYRDRGTPWCWAGAWWLRYV